MKFKKGDRVKCIYGAGGKYGPQVGQEYTVVAADSSHIGIECPKLSTHGGYSEEVASGEATNWGHSSFELVSQPSRKVIGYKLLKDLPGIPAGTTTQVGTISQDGSALLLADKYSSRYTKELFEDTTWFEPIYEEEKVVVELSNGKATIEGNTVTVRVNHQPPLTLDFPRLKDFHHQLTSIDSLGGYAITIPSFLVGCQTFTMEDLEKVLKAIPKPVEESVVKVGLKFTCEGEDHTITYKVINVSPQQVKIEWFDTEDEETKTTSYSKEGVEEYFHSGKWKPLN